MRVEIRQNSLAVVQPHISTPQPGPVILVLVGNKALNYCRFPGLQRISIFVWAVSVTRRTEEGLAMEGGLARCTAPLNIWFMLTLQQLWDNSTSK